MMRLYFDIGNTRLKWVIDSLGVVVDSGAVDYRQNDLSDLILPPGLVFDCVLASCVASSDVRHMVEQWVGAQFSLAVEWAVVTEQQCGVRNGYQSLPQLGVDRWMAVIGARRYLLDHGLSDCSAIIVDAGTAVTVDVLDAQAQFNGGVILPGLKMMHDALVGRTAGIDSSLTGDVRVLGSNTQECVNSGVHYGFLGAIERVVVEVVKDLSLPEADVVLLLTGGDAELVKASLSLDVDAFRVCEVLPMLVVDGLRCVANSGGFK